MTSVACSLGPVRPCHREAWVMNVEKDDDKLVLPGDAGAVFEGLAPFSGHERQPDGYWSELGDVHRFLRPLGIDSRTKTG